jgi:2-polyprenyl-6-methoxyphenol hydroxylase-like FAD-dependent oxidoreductase
MEIVIVGAGIGGLTLALCLQRAGIPCCVYETATEIRALGVGINILPQASRELARLGLEAELTRASVLTREAVFFNRFGQLIHREPLGRDAGDDAPQYSIHRGELQRILVEAVRQRLGADRIVTGRTCTGIEHDGNSAVAHFRDTTSGRPLASQRADAIVACDGLHSIVRKQLHPDEGPPLYSGVNMWRGVTVRQPILTGASMIRAGWLATGKMVIYPIRDDVDGAGRQLVNWVAELATPRHRTRDWTRAGVIEDFIGAFDSWRFEWLDVPALIRGAERIFEFPMVDQEPLPWWSKGRITLLGDAAHPMYPRGSNGAGQAILDARTLSDALAAHGVVDALQAYEAVRLPVTTTIVRLNRANPPDAILREVYERTGDQPFRRIEDVISHAELVAITAGYRRATGFEPSPVEGA